MRTQRSFLKWVGGKGRIVDTIINHLPKGERLIEPFAGAGNVFINANFKRYVLADINHDLINIYKCLNYNHEKLISRVIDIFDGDMDYYEMRHQYNHERMSCIERAAYFIYLNRHCFNGVCRYNKLGKFNVSKGSHKKIYLPQSELTNFANKLTQCDVAIANIGFSETIACVVAEDVIYCDPPYLPISGTANFAGYHSSNFAYAQHERLARDLYHAVKRGASAVVSNSDCDESRYLFRNFEIHEITAPRSCAASGKSRGSANEIICVLTPDMLRS